jgi:hypothetical protein
MRVERVKLARLRPTRLDLERNEAIDSHNSGGNDLDNGFAMCAFM